MIGSNKTFQKLIFQVLGLSGHFQRDASIKPVCKQFNLPGHSSDVCGLILGEPEAVSGGEGRKKIVKEK